MKIGIIGAGNMGGAVYRALVTALPKKNLLITDRHTGKLRALGVKGKPATTGDIIKQSSVIILAMKPQAFKEFCSTLPTKLNSKLIISILAGTTLRDLAKGTGATHVVRTLPNLPMAVGSGVTLWTASRAVTGAEKKLVKKILAAGGLALELKNEMQLTKLTALSGCGPAYFYYLTELLASEARRFGLSERAASELAAATFVGAAKLLAAGKKSPSEWRIAVTSKKGVTEAALKEFARQKFPARFRQAIQKAVRRNVELSK